ncbi:hypothetical protein D1872_280290 [compost metagenome]
MMHQNLRYQEQGREAAQIGGNPDDDQQHIVILGEQGWLNERLWCPANAEYEQYKTECTHKQHKPGFIGQEQQQGCRTNTDEQCANDVEFAACRLFLGKQRVQEDEHDQN